MKALFYKKKITLRRTITTKEYKFVSAEEVFAPFAKCDRIIREKVSIYSMPRDGDRFFIYTHYKNDTVEVLKVFRNAMIKALEAKKLEEHNASVALDLYNAKIRK